ncbi:NHL domain-containing protein, partial [Prosthecobacter vanneervenii]
MLILLCLTTAVVRAAVINPAYTIGSEVPVTTTTYTATGSSLGAVTLGFSPSPSQVLTVVNNTGISTISGIFTGLAEGAKLSAAYGGNTFTLRISYVGGDGNDITLTRVGGTAQIPNGGGYTWTTLAGSLGGVGSQDRTGAQASFYYPFGTAVDSSGSMYVADTFNHTIRKVTSAGVVSTLAGSAGESGSADGTGSVARFNNPTGVAVDSAGNVYVADKYNHTIRKVTSAGVVSTLAGSAGVKGSTDDTGSAARFFSPSGVAVDSAGNVYVADLGNHTIRKVTAAGVVSTLAGSAGVIGSVDDTGSAASFNIPSGVAVDSAGNVYVADSGNSVIRKVTEAGVVSTLAGSTEATGSMDGTGSAARFNNPSGVAVDSAGNVYVADGGNSTIRKVTSAGVVSTLAGSAEARGSADGTGSAARFNNPGGVAVDSAGNVYVADYINSAIRKVTTAGVVSTLAGSAEVSGSVDGTASSASFNTPTGVVVDNAGNVYVADQFNHTIRKVTAAGVVSTLAGSAGVSGSADGTGSAAEFYYPSSVAVDSAGNVYVADQFNHTIRKVTAAGVVSTLAGSAG